MNFDPHAFIDSLYYMGTGMLGIFAVIGLIIIITYILNGLTSKKNNSSEKSIDK